LGDNVKVLNFQAISTAVETHRGIGQPLFPELKSLKFLLGKKSLLASSHWESLYQGKPTVEGGNLFKDNHWKYYTALPKMRFRMIYADTALKKEEQHDWSVLQCWGMSYDGHIYLLDQVRKKVEAPQLLTMARAFWNKHNDITNLGVLRQMKPEDKASGTGLIQTLRQEGIPIKGIQRNRDKVSRANDVTPMIEVGNVYIPEDATWLNDYLVEFSAFPNGDNDDQIDPTMDAIEDLLINPAVVNYEDLI
jgi:predicted phage terminase large subunit-like protein